jgi:methionyl-tRNA formyltransferase
MEQNFGKFAYFGSSRLSVIVLDRLLKKNIKPNIIVTTVDKLVGRKQILTPNVVKVWANEHNIPVLDPEKLNDGFIDKFEQICKTENIEYFLVASYNKIIPKKLVEMPKFGILNIHPSLLPKYRGPSPLGSAILADDKNTGVTIMKIDNEMDHGPIVAVKEVHIEEWMIYEDYEEMMAKIGADLFTDNISDYLSGKIIPEEQDHTEASYTKKFEKEDGLISLQDEQRKNWLKYLAFHSWPQVYFILKNNEKEMRIKITEAKFENDKFIPLKVIPEGSKEMTFEAFKNGYKLDY